MTAMGRAAVATSADQPIELREYPVPAPSADEILVRTTVAGLCGSDLHIWRGEVPPLQPYPSVPGHEGTGRVVALGTQRQHDTLGRPLAVGDRVAYSYFVPCGECWLCLSGTTGCPNRYQFKAHVRADDPPHFLGTYAEYMLLHPGQWVFKVPDGIPDDLLAPVNCALSQVICGLHRIGIWLGDTVVVQGAGGLGLYAAAVARDMGAGQVVSIDAIPQRLGLARDFGADLTLNVAETTKEERVEAVWELTGGMGADVCVEVVGVPGVVQEGLELLRPGGRYLMMGNIVPDVSTEIIPHDAVRQPKQLLGVLSYDRWVLPRALAWLSGAQHRYPLDRLVSRRYPLEQINAAFTDAEWAAQRGEVARILIAP